MVGKKVLVTGGAGFIGSNLCEHLLTLGNHVNCLDNLSTGFEKNLAPFMENPNFTFINGDIRDLETCQKAVEGVDVVFHQAALGSVPRSIENPIASTESNVNGFLNMLVASKDEPSVDRLIFASSSSVYGNNQDLPKLEEKIGTPLSPYAVTKYCNELYAHVFGQVYGLKTIGLRYFNVFGKSQTPEGAYAAAIPKFIQRMMKGQPIEIYGDGEQSRDFTYIENVIHANLCAATAERDDAFGQIYNVACGDRITINKVVQLIAQSLEKSLDQLPQPQINYVEKRAGDLPHSHASIDKAKEMLGYEPKVYFGDGMDKAISWYINHLS